MFAKAQKAVNDLKARGFEICKPFTEEDAVLLIRDGWGVSIPKSEKVWRERGENPLACWHWSPASEEEEEASA